MSEPTEIPFEVLLTFLLLQPNPAQKVSFTVHPDCFMVTVYDHEGKQIGGISSETAFSFASDARDLMGSLLVPEAQVADTEPPTSLVEETAPEATPPHADPAAPPTPPHSASDPETQPEEVFGLGEATPESPSSQ